MAKLTSITGGKGEDEFLGEYMMVYFDEDGNITLLFSLRRRRLLELFVSCRRLIWN